MSRANYPQGLSDGQKNDELRAQSLVLPAVAALRSAIQDAMLLSTVMGDELHDLSAALDDSAPSAQQWVEAVQRADDACTVIPLRKVA